jgi:hypothetical protein
MLLGMSVVTVSASSGSASLKGFDVDGWTYYDDTYENAIAVYDSSDRFYGTIDMWSAMYYIYDYQEDVMYYAILVETVTNANTTITFWQSYSTYNMDLGITIDGDYVNIVNYIPQQTSGSYNLSVSIATDSIGFTLDEEYDEIELFVNEYSSGDCVAFNYIFTRYRDNINASPYKGTYKQKTVVLLEVEDYSQVWYQTELDVLIGYNGSFFRDGFWDNQFLGDSLFETFTLEPFGVL